MPCEPGQFKGCQQGSQVRVEDPGSHEATQARDSVQHAEDAVLQQQVPCDGLEQEDQQGPEAEEVLVTLMKDTVPQTSQEVVIVAANPEVKPSGDSAREQEARQLCEAIGEVLQSLKPGADVPAEVERKLVVLIERLEKLAQEHSPLWKLGFSVCEELNVQTCLPDRFCMMSCELRPAYSSLSTAPAGSPPYPIRVISRNKRRRAA